MLLGFISLLLTVLQDRIAKICIPQHLANQWLPCKKKDESSSSSSTSHLQISFFSGIGRRLLASSSASTDYCSKKGKVPLLSTTALHHLHIFIFVLAIVHVTFCVLTIIFGGAKIRQWKQWEDSIQSSISDSKEGSDGQFTHVRDHSFIKDHFRGVGKRSTLIGWLHAFFKQFNVFASVTKSDYITLRYGFIKTHSKGNLKFNFHKYMIRALEADFKKVVGISWYLWIFVVVFLLLNVYGWHAYFWIAFVPFTLMLAVGAKLEHVITQLAHEVAERHVAIEGALEVRPSDHHFWFHKPQIVLILIHIILFQNSFELAVFFWIWIQYKFDSCIMGEVGYIIPRLVIGVFVQFMCSYSTLPLYAIVTQMGSTYKKAIFEEHVQVGIAVWQRKAKINKGMGLKKESNGGSATGQVDHRDDSPIEKVEETNTPREIEVVTLIDQPKPTA